MWMSEVEMKVWIRGRSESLIAFQAASTSALCVRARPQMTGPWEAGLHHVDAEAGELLRDLELLLGVQRDPRGLLAVAQRRIEDVDPVLL